MAVRTIIFRGKRIDNGEWVEGCIARLVYTMRWQQTDTTVNPCTFMPHLLARNG